jgi:hypothetical protein
MTTMAINENVIRGLQLAVNMLAPQAPKGTRRLGIHHTVTGKGLTHLEKPRKSQSIAANLRAVA